MAPPLVATDALSGKNWPRQRSLAGRNRHFRTACHNTDAELLASQTPRDAVKDKALEIILVNSKSARKPSDAQALAQNRLDGGGNVDENRRAKTPLPPSAQQQAGAELEQRQRRVQELEAQQQKLLSQTKSKTKTASSNQREAQPGSLADALGTRTCLPRHWRWRAEAEISKNVDEYNKRPRKEEHRRPCRRVPLRAIRRGLAPQGRARRHAELSRSSQGQALRQPRAVGQHPGRRQRAEDRNQPQLRSQGARRRRPPHRADGLALCRLPADIRRDTDIIEITRTWTFTRSDALETR